MGVCERMQSNQANQAGRVYRRLLSYVRPYWFVFLLGILATVLYSSVDAGVTYLLKPGVDQGFIGKNQDFIKWVPLGLLTIFVLRGFASFVSTYCMTWVGRTVVMEFRQHIFSHLLRLPAAYFDKRTSGELLATIIYNVEQVAEASTTSLITIVRESVFVLGLLTVMMVVSWRLTLMFFIIAPVIAIIVTYSSRRLRRLSKNVQNLVGSITQVAEEGIEGYRVIRTYGGERYECDKFNQVTEANRKREMNVAVVNGLTSPIVQLLAGIVIIITVYLATMHVANITPGGFVSFIGAMLLILKPLKNLTTVNSSIQKGIAGADSIFDLLDTEAERDIGQRSLPNLCGDIVFKDVCFSYGNQSADVLHDINLTVKAGETIAIVGRSGAGKSSLVSLLPRFYDTTSGTITLDNLPIDSLKLYDLRQQIAYVSQQIVLFNDSIEHNIAYGRLDSATTDDVVAAAKAAHAYEFIMQFEQGFKTQIGEKGLRLSGGQRQRLSIARAILKNAPILILDEATSSLDSESERYIQAALEKLMRGRTSFVIAHRLSTIERADKIIVMDAGKIIEIGNHQQLLKSSKIYAHLYAMQFKEPVNNDE